MEQQAIYAITAPITALISCAFITLFMKNFKLKPAIRCTIVFIAYILFIFIIGGSGNGIVNMDFTSFNWTQFVYRLVAGICVCLFLFLFYSRGDIARKLQDKKDAKKQAKGE